MPEKHRLNQRFLNVGYGDYSTFYRAYQRLFGHPPTQDKGNPDDSGRFSGWLQEIPFMEPENSFRAVNSLDKSEFPDIGFENNGYAVLE